MIICDFQLKRTENNNFTIITNTSQHVEFFHSLIFLKKFSILASKAMTTSQMLIEFECYLWHVYKYGYRYGAVGMFDHTR